MISGTLVLVAMLGQTQPLPKESVIDQVVRLTNAEREKAGVRKLDNNSLLETIAEHQAKDMQLMRKLTHADRQGRDVSQRADFYKYPWMAIGENVAQGQRSAKEVVDDWMKSKGHRANILNPDFSEIGVSRVGNYWVQVFGSR